MPTPVLNTCSLLLQTKLDSEYNPTDQLHPAALELLKSNGCLATTVQHCIEGAHAQRVHEMVNQVPPSSLNALIRHRGEVSCSPVR